MISPTTNIGRWKWPEKKKKKNNTASLAGHSHCLAPDGGFKVWSDLAIKPELAAVVALAR